MAIIFFARFFEVDAHIFEYSGCNALTFAEQSEQNMFGTDNSCG